MYLTDDLGNRYNHISVGGGAAKDIAMKNGESIVGWFIFPPAQPGVSAFTFHDSDNDIAIKGIVLSDPIIVNEELALKWYPLAVDYKVAVCKAGESEEGGGLLTHSHSQFSRFSM
jgi:hypothetical protein